MGEKENFQDQIIERKLEEPQVDYQQQEEPAPNVLAGILRRWYIVLIVFVLISAAGLPAVWYFIKPAYQVNGAIRVAPIIPNLITGEPDTGNISNYERFMRTQASMIVSDRVVQRVADDLADRDLDFFEKYTAGLEAQLKQKLDGTEINREPAAVLKKAISNGDIQAIPARDTELIKVSMKSADSEEAKQIIDSFIKSYMSVEVASSNQEQNQKLQLLESERESLDSKMDSLRKSIRELAEEYGSTTLTNRQKMMLERVSSLLSELTKNEAKIANLEARAEMLKNSKEDSIPQDKLLQMKTEYINSNPSVQQISQRIVALEQDLIQAKQTYHPNNPVIEQKEELIDALEAKLEEKREEASEEFNKTMANQAGRTNQEKLEDVQAELALMKEYQKKLQNKVDSEDLETKNVGRTQLDIEKLQNELASTKEMYNKIDNRIKELKMEQKQPARISVAYNADVAGTMDKRVKFSAAVLFFAAACGGGLAFLLDKADKNVYSPQEVTECLGTRLLGTTTSYRALRRAQLPGQIQQDYESIYANLNLFNGNGLPKKIVVTSAGVKEGKTTFSANLASILASRGRKVLLIDGDLRKPDIGNLLGLPKGEKGLLDVIFDKKFENVVYTGYSPNIDILASDSSNSDNAAVLLETFRDAGYMDTFSRKYDHIIVDTPPVLAFPDALLWAKIAGSVILISFAGQTNSKELQQVKTKLTDINVEVLGTVLGNVAPKENYYHYGYYHSNGYYRSKRDYKKSARLLISSQEK